MLSKPGTNTFSEIVEQPQTWTLVCEALEQRQGELQGWLRDEKFGQVVLVGCGSSYHAGLAAARVFHRISGLNAQALPASEVLYSPRPPYDVRIKTLLIGLSRSGETSETVWAVEKLAKLDSRLRILTITCKRETELQALGHQALVFPFALEEGPLATRSTSATLLALETLAAWISGNQALIDELKSLPGLVDIRKQGPEIQKAVALKATHVTFLGNGPFYGVAGASALLMRETSYIQTDYSHLLEYRHGFHSAIQPTTLIVAFLTDAMRKAEEEMLREIAVMRGPRMIICPQADVKTKMGSEFVFELGETLSEPARLVLSLPYGQLLAFYHAINRGANPDRPKHLQPVVKLKERIGS